MMYLLWSKSLFILYVGITYPVAKWFFSHWFSRKWRPFFYFSSPCERVISKTASANNSWFVCRHLRIWLTARWKGSGRFSVIFVKMPAIFFFFYPPPNLFGVGAMASPWTSVRYRSISRKSMGDYFRIAPTHHLGDVDMPFGGYDLWPTYLAPNTFISFNISNIWHPSNNMWDFEEKWEISTLDNKLSMTDYRPLFTLICLISGKLCQIADLYHKRKYETLWKDA